MKPASDDSLSLQLIRNGIRLAAFTAVVVSVLAVVHDSSRDAMVEQRLNAERQQLDAVLPALTHDNDLLTSAFTLDPAGSEFQQLALLGLSTARTGYRATLQGKASGVILPLETAQGFNGPIVLLVGVDTEGRVTGVRVVSHTETRGLGDQIEADDSRWILAFDNRSLANTPPVLWQVKKDGGDFDQFVGATITPRAVVGAIHNALLFFEANRDSLLAR